MNLLKYFSDFSHLTVYNISPSKLDSSHAWQKLVCYSVIGWKKHRMLKFRPESQKAGKNLNGLCFSEFSHFTVYNVSPSKLDSSHAWLRKAEGRKLANCVVVGVVSLTQIYWLFFRHFCAELYFKVRIVWPTYDFKSYGHHIASPKDNPILWENTAQEESSRWGILVSKK